MKHLRLNDEGGNRMPESRIVRNGNAFLLEADGEKMPLYGYLTYQPENTCYEDFKQAGIRLFFCTVYAGDRGINQLTGIRPFRPGFWKGYGQYDFSQADADFRRIAGSSKPGEIYIIPRIMTEAPSWWDEKNPGELCRDAHGTPLHQSFLSKKWLEDTEKMLSDFQVWLEESGWDRFIAGWHMAAGNTEEFLRPSHRAAHMTDYSLPAQRGFQAWAQKKFSGSLAQMNAAWHSLYGSFDEIPIPSPAKRLYTLDGDLRSGEAERETIDYYAYMNESVAQAAVSLCAAAKRVTKRRLVIGAFYGYMAGGPECGQHAARIAFESPEIDFFASPFCYTDNRAPGIDWPFQGSVDSAALHGKPWFMEADVRTCLSRPISQCMKQADPYVNRAYDGPVWYGPDTVEGSLGQMLKAFSRVLTHNTAIWWFDMWGGWYSNERFMDFHQKACALYREHFLAGGSRNAGEIAFFMDDETFFRIRPTGGLSGLQNHILWKNMGFVGAPYRLYMMDDFPSIDPAAFRMAIFASIPVWTEERLKALKKWKSGGRVLAFLGPMEHFPASGIASLRFSGKEDLSRARARNGEQAQNDESLYFTDKARGKEPPPAYTPILRWETAPGDVFFETDDWGVQALLRREADYSVYADAAVAPEADRIRELLNAAGGQIYTDGGDAAYASDTHIAVHAASDGVKRIHIPGKGRLIDAMTGEALPGCESFADVKMVKGETLLLRVQPLDASGT